MIHQNSQKKTWFSKNKNRKNKCGPKVENYHHINNNGMPKSRCEKKIHEYCPLCEQIGRLMAAF